MLRQRGRKTQSTKDTQRACEREKMHSIDKIKIKGGENRSGRGREGVMPEGYLC